MFKIETHLHVSEVSRCSKIKAIAVENGLYMTSGSDAHRFEDVAKAGVISENEIKTVKDYIDLIKSGKAGLIGG